MNIHKKFIAGLRALLMPIDDTASFKNKSIDCTGCRYLYYNNDGSVGCESRFEKACLHDPTRPFKVEPEVMEKFAE